MIRRIASLSFSLMLLGVSHLAYASSHMDAPLITLDDAANTTDVYAFVSERGGGFLMLGGTESFQQGKFARTPIGDMMPAYLDQPLESAPPRQWRLALTREGWLQPWARLRQNESDDQARLDAMPPFQVLNRVRGIKPGASVIATVSDGQGSPFPAVIVQRFGRGRAAAVTLGDLWRWGLRDEAMHRDMDKAWRQLMRWLVTDVPGRIELQVEPKRGDPNQAVSIEARPHDKPFQPRDNATVIFSVRSVGQSVPTPDKAGPTNAAPAARAGDAPVLRLNAEPAQIMHASDTQERLAAMATDPLTSTPAEFGASLKHEIAKSGDLGRTPNLQAA